MENTDLEPLTNTAHYYMECSNKGICDRTTGECDCYFGYDGAACQRASCPGFPDNCHGHGVCRSIEQLAQDDHGNVYKLWDRSSTMGCQCDPGYTGPDCSLRVCKYDVDPLYYDDSATIKYSTWDMAVLTNAATPDFTDGHNQPGEGLWAIRFYDVYGEDWLTSPLTAGASCDQVVEALENIPNDVIPHGSVYCTFLEIVGGTENLQSVEDAQLFGTRHSSEIWYKMAWWEYHTSDNMGELSEETALNQGYTSSDQASAIIISGYIYRLKFYGNPGKLKEPEIELYLDGSRPSLASTDGKVVAKVWTDGQQGDGIDYFADVCHGVTVEVAFSLDANGNPTSQSYLTGFTREEKFALKDCFGDSDFDPSNNVDIHNWDHGSKMYPHVVKLVRVVTRSVNEFTDGGHYAVIYYDTTVKLDNADAVSDGTFMLLNPFFSPDQKVTDMYEVYTTKGVLALTSNQSEATFGFGSRHIYTSNVSYDTSDRSIAPYDGDISCEVSANNPDKMRYVQHCLNKSDLFFLINWEAPLRNPPRLNMYTAERVYTQPFQHTISDRFDAARRRLTYQYDSTVKSGKEDMHFMTNMITTDLNTNWGAAAEDNGSPADILSHDFFHVYKFYPNEDSTYPYVLECSGRGLCDQTVGECRCFSGYSSDSCHVQTSVGC